MRFSNTATLLCLSFSLFACSNAADTPAATGSPVETTNAAEVERPATFVPKLAPATVVWDSPEKQKAWEARQAAIAAQSATSTK